MNESSRSRMMPNEVARRGSKKEKSTATSRPLKHRSQRREALPDLADEFAGCESRDPLRANQEHEDDDDEGDHRSVRERDAEPIVERADSQVLREPDDEAACDRAPERGEAAQDRSREQPQKDSPTHLRRPRYVHDPERAAKAGKAAGQEPRESTNVRRLDARHASEVKVRCHRPHPLSDPRPREQQIEGREDRKSTRLNSSHVKISYAVF